MQKFTVESELNTSCTYLQGGLWSISAVNYELAPFICMIAPNRWRSIPIYQWPTDRHIFNSWVLFLGFLPLDYHKFYFTQVSASGFRENSSSLIHSSWQHTRSLIELSDGVMVRDEIEYQAKLNIVGYLLRPVYKFIFNHRHKRLKLKYL